VADKAPHAELGAELAIAIGRMDDNCPGGGGFDPTADGGNVFGAVDEDN
jgi:hypothetical protein